MEFANKTKFYGYVQGLSILPLEVICHQCVLIIILKLFYAHNLLLYMDDTNYYTNILKFK